MDGMRMKDKMGKSKDLQIIMELMEELGAGMDYSEDDIMSRLGKKKPDLEIMKVEGKVMPKKMMMIEGGDDEEMEKESDMAMAEGDDSEMGEEADLEMMGLDPDEKLKKRIMKLRA